MSKSSRYKLIIPMLYALASAVYLYLSWPDKPTLVHLFGATLTVIAFALWITARVQLGNAFSIGPKASELVTTGLYSKFRHPVYYTSILAMLGLCIFSGQLLLWLALLVLIVLEVARIRKEETVLGEAFGERYTQYKQATWF